MSIELIPVRERRQLKEFIRFPLSLYKGCDKWVPAFESDEYKSLGPDNPSLSFCERELYLAVREGRTVGRVAAILNRKANEKWGENSVRFGWIDFVEDFEVARALIGAVEAWGRERGAVKIKGPLGFTDMDREGLLVEGFENESPFTVIYNYPYYPEYLERLGFTKDVDWTQRVMVIPEQIPPVFEYAHLIEDRYKIRVLRASTLGEMAKRGREMFHVLNEAFAGLYEYSKLSEEQILAELPMTEVTDTEKDWFREIRALPELQERIFSNMSSRQKEMIQSDMQYLHNLRMRDVEAAQ